MSDTRRFCGNCGSALESDDHFCPSCGHETASQGAPGLATTAAHATAPLEAGARTSQIASTAVDMPAPDLAAGAERSGWLTRTVGAHKVVAATIAALVVVGAVAGVVAVSGGSKPGAPGSAGSPSTAAAGLVDDLLAGNFRGMCAYEEPGAVAQCTSGVDQLSSVIDGKHVSYRVTGNLAVVDDVVEGDRALVALKGRVCIGGHVPGYPAGGSCSVNANPSRGMPSATRSFQSAYAAAVADSNDALSPLPMTELDGRWYVSLPSSSFVPSGSAAPTPTTIPSTRTFPTATSTTVASAVPSVATELANGEWSESVPEVRPASIALNPNEPVSGFLDLRWSKWTDVEAVGTGDFQTDCGASPDCTNSVPIAVTITLSDPSDGVFGQITCSPSVSFGGGVLSTWSLPTPTDPSPEIGVPGGGSAGSAGSAGSGSSGTTGNTGNLGSSAGTGAGANSGGTGNTGNSGDFGNSGNS